MILRYNRMHAENLKSLYWQVSEILRHATTSSAAAFLSGLRSHGMYTYGN